MSKISSASISKLCQSNLVSQNYETLISHIMSYCFQTLCNYFEEVDVHFLSH